MGLRIVGAGLPRTGTSSLRLALEQLLGGRCYHMSVIPGHPFDLGRGLAGGFTLDLARAVLGAESVTLDALASLVDHSLVHCVEDAASEQRFGLLEIVRLYALEHLACQQIAEDGLSISVTSLARSCCDVSWSKDHFHRVQRTLRQVVDELRPMAMPG